MDGHKRYEKVQEERMIGTTDLLLEFARRIRLIIVMVVVFAILLCGYKYVKDLKSLEVKDEGTVAENELTDDELKEVEDIQSLRSLFDNQREYAERSVFMQLNPYDVSMTSVHFYIAMPEESQIDEEKARSERVELNRAYCAYISNGGLTEDLKSKGINDESRYLQEVISCKISGEKDETGYSFDVQIRHYDEKTCKEWADQAIQCILDYGNDLKEEIIPHTISAIDTAYSKVVDSDIAERQLKCLTQLQTLEENITNQEAKLSDEQKGVLEKQEEKASTDEVPQTVNKPQISKKYFVLGAGIGFVLACVYIVIVYLLRGTVNSVNDIRYIYNSRVLAEINISPQKRFYSYCKRKLLHTRELLTREEEQKLLVSNVRNLCGQNDIKKIILNCSYKEKDIVQWLTELKTDLEKEKIELVVLHEGLENAYAIEQMAETKHVILAEKVYHTSYEMMTREMEICMEQEVQVIGVILLS